MASRMSLVSWLWQSAYSAPAYRAAAAGGTGRAFAYLALLAAIATVLMTAQSQMMLGSGIRTFKQTRWWDTNLPEITISGGKASSPVAQPFRKEFSDDLVFILDTTGGVPDVTAPNAVVLTQTQLTVRQARRGQTRTYDLSRFPNVVLNQQTIEQWLDGLMRWLWLAMAAALFAWHIFGKLLQVLVCSLAGLIVNAAAGRRLSYGAIYRIGILALTVPWFVSHIAMIAGLQVPMLGLLTVGLYLGYYVWGILVQPQAAESASSSPEPVHAP